MGWDGMGWDGECGRWKKKRATVVGAVERFRSEVGSAGGGDGAAAQCD